jgi:hypothetical protein
LLTPNETALIREVLATRWTFHEGGAVCGLVVWKPVVGFHQRHSLLGIGQHLCSVGAPTGDTASDDGGALAKFSRSRQQTLTLVQEGFGGRRLGEDGIGAHAIDAFELLRATPSSQPGWERRQSFGRVE